MRNLIQNSLILTIVLGGLTGCDGASVILQKDPLLYAWSAVYNPCAEKYSSPQAGCNYYWYGTENYLHDASDDLILNFEKNFHMVYGEVQYFYGVWSKFIGFHWKSRNGIVYDDYRNTLGLSTSIHYDYLYDEMRRADNTDSRPRDTIEKENAKLFGVQFARSRTYNGAPWMSDETGIKIAWRLQEWGKLGKDRERTAEDVDNFCEEVLGVRSSEIELAAKQYLLGNTDPAYDVVVKIAVKLGMPVNAALEFLQENYQINIPYRN